ncbi:MAG: hypothetical protein JKY94_09860 [Rhodobacteraceae bacterium]|nr:hypothetical protein [Paracoccaceae bacterium]
MTAPTDRILKALEVAHYGNIDGAHHKAWVIDQMVRAICVSDAAYDLWVACHKTGEDGPETYSWDTGIAP